MPRNRTALARFALVLLLSRSSGCSAQEWHDPSPHRVATIRLPVGRVQYLDWGGTGAPLILLHGWNSNAHVFDDLAPRLTDRFHVVAVSLPAFGASDAPKSGYGLNDVADAVIGLMDSLSIARASFAGHSFGGWVLTRLATRYPDRVNKLVYLDAAFDANASDSLVARRPVKRPPLTNVRSQADVIAWLHHDFFGMWTPSLEAEYRGRSADEPARAAVLQPLFDEARRGPDHWADINAPVLAICALAEVSSEFPWLTTRDSAYDVARRYIERERRPFQHAECERFRRTVPHATTIELSGHHYIFEQHQADVVRAMQTFLLNRESPSGALDERARGRQHTDAPSERIRSADRDRPIRRNRSDN
ncbi:MAG: alpha/beta hydrolase [Gemmatimonadaceae bacterium]